MKEFTIGQNDAGQRLDRFLAKAVPLLPASLAQKYIRIKRIKCNGKRIDRDTRLQEGDVLQLYINDEFFDKPREDNAYLTVAAPKLNIVYEDEHLLILNKPAGLATDADRYSSMTVTDWAALHAQGAYQPRLCHRLDYQTSGLIALAKDDMAENALKEMFARRTGRKEYQCLVLGTPQPAQADCHAFLIKDPVRAVVHGQEERHARHFSVIQRHPGWALRPKRPRRH